MVKNNFLDENFLLRNEFSKNLYHNYVKDLPIIDYHNHLSPKDISENRRFNNITEVWLQGDHYKWRAMRALGIDEHYITGAANDRAKFMKWAETVPYTIRNPLYHWSHLELKRYFGIRELLSPQNAAVIYDLTQESLTQSKYQTQGLLELTNVQSVCTTDDPIDDLSYHKDFSNQKKSLKLLPTFRPDKAFAIEHQKNYLKYLDKLSTASNVEIKSFDTLLEALKNRIDYFHDFGCRLSDQGLEQLFCFKQGLCDPQTIFDKIKSKQHLTKKETHYFKFEIIQFLSKYYHQKGWVQQFHLGSIRNNNKRLLEKLGPDTGFDSIGDYSQAKALSGYLNTLDKTNQLAKTIIYNLNPSDNEVFATMAGNFNDGSYWM